MLGAAFPGAIFMEMQRIQACTDQQSTRIPDTKANLNTKKFFFQWSLAFKL